MPSKWASSSAGGITSSSATAPRFCTAKSRPENTICERSAGWPATMSAWMRVIMSCGFTGTPTTVTFGLASMNSAIIRLVASAPLPALERL